MPNRQPDPVPPLVLEPTRIRCEYVAAVPGELAFYFSRDLVTVGDFAPFLDASPGDRTLLRPLPGAGGPRWRWTGAGQELLRIGLDQTWSPGSAPRRDGSPTADGPGMRAGGGRVDRQAGRPEAGPEAIGPLLGVVLERPRRPEPAAAAAEGDAGAGRRLRRRADVGPA